MSTPLLHPASPKSPQHLQPAGQVLWYLSEAHSIGVVSGESPSSLQVSCQHKDCGL